MAKTKIKKLEDEVKDATVKANKDVELANESYHEFMSYYADYQSDLKRRGSINGLRKSSKDPEEGNRQSKDSNKETKRLD